MREKEIFSKYEQEPDMSCINALHDNEKPILNPYEFLLQNFRLNDKLSSCVFVPEIIGKVSTTTCVMDFQVYFLLTIFM